MVRSGLRGLSWRRAKSSTAPISKPLWGGAMIVYSNDLGARLALVCERARISEPVFSFQAVGGFIEPSGNELAIWSDL